MALQHPCTSAATYVTFHCRIKKIERTKPVHSRRQFFSHTNMLFIIQGDTTAAAADEEEEDDDDDDDDDCRANNE